MPKLRRRTSAAAVRNAASMSHAARRYRRRAAAARNNDRRAARRARARRMTRPSSPATRCTTARTSAPLLVEPGKPGHRPGRSADPPSRICPAPEVVRVDAGRQRRDQYDDRQRTRQGPRPRRSLLRDLGDSALDPCSTSRPCGRRRTTARGPQPFIRSDRRRDDDRHQQAVAGRSGGDGGGQRPAVEARAAPRCQPGSGRNLAGAGEIVAQDRDPLLHAESIQREQDGDDRHRGPSAIARARRSRRARTRAGRSPG